MDKSFIIEEIRRVAAENGGRSPGSLSFRTETGMGEAKWRGRYWARWSDALIEAGFEPNVPKPRLSEAFLLETYVEVIRRRLPMVLGICRSPIGQ